MNDFAYLWRQRERPDFGSRRWLVVWAKRALTFTALLRILNMRRRFRAQGVTVGALSILHRFDLKGGSAANLSIGEHSFISGSAEIIVHDKVTIGSRVVINDRVTMLTASHHVDDPGWRQFHRPIVIEDYAWIAVGATILPGVRIGRGAVVGAGAVVARDVPARAVATGNPATNRLDVRPTELSYDPVALLPPYEAWIGRNRDAAAPLVMPSPEIESRT